MTEPEPTCRERLTHPWKAPDGIGCRLHEGHLNDGWHYTGTLWWHREGPTVQAHAPESPDDRPLATGGVVRQPVTAEPDPIECLVPLPARVDLDAVRERLAEVRGERRPRSGDLETATRPHAPVPSGEYVGAGAERCDLCGLASTNLSAHPNGAPVVLTRADLVRRLDEARAELDGKRAIVEDLQHQRDRARAELARNTDAGIAIAEQRDHLRGKTTHIGLPGGVLTINGPVTPDEVAEFRRRLGRCGDRSPTLHPAAVPSRCVLDVGHTGSHTDGRGCEWMYTDDEETTTT